MKKAIVAFFAVTAIAAAQGILSVAPPRKVTVKRGAAVEAKLDVSLQPGFHVNSDKPDDEYLIPLRLRWEQGPLAPVEIVYPAAEHKKYSYSEKPLAVFAQRFQIVTRFKAAAGAPPGPGILTGKLRYQACAEDRCYPPRTVDVKLPYTIE